MTDEEDFDYVDDDNEILDCPACGREYDEIDIDYLRCSKCGWDENKKRYDLRLKSRGWSGYGIDPDVTHRINTEEL